MTTEFVGPTITLAELAMRIALGEEGVREQPPGSDRGPEIDEYLRAAGLDPTRASYPWCAAFVSWAVLGAVNRLKCTPAFRGSASVAALWEHNRTTLALEQPEPNCVFLHFGADGHNHCGFVTLVNGDGSLATFEGNTDSSGSRTGGQAMHQHRPAGYATRFLRIG